MYKLIHLFHNVLLQIKINVKNACLHNNYINILRYRYSQFNLLLILGLFLIYLRLIVLMTAQNLKENI